MHPLSDRVRIRLLTLTVAAAVAVTAACDDSGKPTPTGFLDGTPTDPGIAFTIASSTNALLMLQTGAPDTRREVAFGASTQITPTSVAIRGGRAAVPLGNAASVALVDLEAAEVDRFFTFPSGNTTGAAWADDHTVIAANQTTDVVGRFRIDQAGTEITDAVAVTPFPTYVVAHAGRIFVISSNLDDNFTPAGPGVVTEINPATMRIVRTFTVGINPQYGAVGPDNRLYVTNSGTFGGNDGTLSIINLQTNLVEGPLSGFGDFPGPINIDAQGRALISSFGLGTLVWHTVTRTFVRGPDNPLCAPRTTSTGAVCRGASGAAFAPNGRIYQAFFGSASSGLPAYLFVYDGTTYALADSIPVPLGANGVEVRSFQ